MLSAEQKECPWCPELVKTIQSSHPFSYFLVGIADFFARRSFTKIPTPNISNKTERAFPSTETIFCLSILHRFHLSTETVLFAL